MEKVRKPKLWEGALEVVLLYGQERFTTGQFINDSGLSRSYATGILSQMLAQGCIQQVEFATYKSLGDDRVKAFVYKAMPPKRKPKLPQIKVVQPVANPIQEEVLGLLKQVLDDKDQYIRQLEDRVADLEKGWEDMKLQLEAQAKDIKARKEIHLGRWDGGDADVG